MKVLFTSYYGLKESLLCAATSLIRSGVSVSDFPLFKYHQDENDRREDYITLFVNFIKDDKPDIILWWYIGLPTKDMLKVKNNIDPKIKHIFFNWDEPLNWISCDIENKASILDIAFVCCAEKLNDYIKFGCKEAYLLYPGFNPTIHNIIIDEDPEDEKKYSCDISIICTNLYEDKILFPNQWVNRKELIDTVYENQDKFGYKFHVYGSSSFSTLYPKSYKGFINYEDTNKVFNYSKINLCTHVQCDKHLYLNERTFMILGSGGLLFIDNVAGLNEILDVNNECIVLNKDKDSYVEQIVNVLQTYDKFYYMRHKGYNKSKMYTWDMWASFILSKLEL